MTLTELNRKSPVNLQDIAQTEAYKTGKLVIPKNLLEAEGLNLAGLGQYVGVVDKQSMSGVSFHKEAELNDFLSLLGSLDRTQNLRDVAVYDLIPGPDSTIKPEIIRGNYAHPFNGKTIQPKGPEGPRVKDGLIGLPANVSPRQREVLSEISEEMAETLELMYFSLLGMFLATGSFALMGMSWEVFEEVNAELEKKAMAEAEKLLEAKARQIIIT